MRGCLPRRSLGDNRTKAGSGGRRGGREASMRDETYSASRILDTIENPRRSRGGAADFPARTGIPIAKTAKRLA